MEEGGEALNVVHLVPTKIKLCLIIYYTSSSSRDTVHASYMHYNCKSVGHQIEAMPL